jgi:branched-chain amino acid transport system permease protein
VDEAVQIIIGGVLQGCIFGLLAIGFSMVYRVAAAINLAQGAFCIVAALLTSTIETELSINVIAAGGLALVATALLALLLGWTVFVPGLARLPVSAMFILTAGLLTLMEGGSLVAWGSQSYTLSAFSGERPIRLGGLLLPPQGLWLVGAAIVVTTGLMLLMHRTRLGRALRACAENPLAASLMGIGVARMQLLSFVLAAVIGGVGGIVMGPVTSFAFDTGRMYTIFGFIAAVIGGIGSPLGGLVGGIALGIATQLAAAYVSSLFSNALALALLLAILLWRPSGLFSSGPARRLDVRDEPRTHRAIIRLDGRPGALLAAGGLVLLFGVLPWTMQSSGLMGSVIITGILFLSALGLDVLMGFAGQVSLGQAGFMAIGGYTASVLAVQYGAPPALGTLAGLVLSLACALVLAIGTMRLRGLYLAIATLAFSLLVDSLTVGLEGFTGGPSGLVGIPSFSIAGFVFDTPLRNYYLVAVVLVLALAVLSGGIRGGFGRALLAVRADPMAAAALGIDVRRAKIAAFCICAALGSISGSLYAFYFHFLSPDMVGTPLSLQMLAMLLIGGEGTLFGPLFGVALLTLLPTVFQPLAQFKTLGSGLLLILFSLYAPSGIFGLLASRLGAARRGPPPLALPLHGGVAP